MRNVKLKRTKDVREALSALAKKHGRLTEEIVVAASKDKSSPLHAMFFWDDPGAAAHIGRLEIARQLIITIRIEPCEKKEYHCNVAIRKYHGLGDGYLPIGEILTKKKLRERLLQSAFRDLQAMLDRYNTLSELDPVRRALSLVMKRKK